MAGRDLRLDVTTSSDNSGLRDAARGLNNLADAADHAGRNARNAGQQLGNLGTSARQGLRQAADETRHLDRRLNEARESVRRLSEEFDRTGDNGLLRQIRAARSQVGELTRIRQALTPQATPNAAPDLPSPNPALAARLASQVTSSITSALPSAFTSLPPQAQVAIAGAVATAITVGAPAIGAAVSGAILVGLGGGVLAAGIASQVKDARVSAAFKDLGETMKSELSNSSSSFVGPLVKAAGVLRAEFAKLDLRGVFAPLAGEIVPLARNLAQMASNAMPGFTRAIAAAAPVLRSLGDQLPKIGFAIGEFMDSMAEAGPGAAKFFNYLGTFAAAAIISLGDSLERLAKAFAFLDFATKAITHDNAGLATFFADSGKSAEEAAPGFNLFAGGLDNVAGSADEAARSIEDLKNRFTESFDQMQGQREAAKGMADALNDLGESIRNHGASLDRTTEAGKANTDMLDAGVDAAKRVYDAELAATKSLDAAKAAYDRSIDSLVNKAKAFGMSEEAARSYIGTLGNVPTTTDTEVRLHNLLKSEDDVRRYNSVTSLIPPVKLTDVQLHNLLKSEDDVRRYTSSLWGIPPIRETVVRTTYETVYRGASFPAAGSSIDLQHNFRAEGGPVKAGQPYIVGEKHAELFVPKADGMIVPQVPDAMTPFMPAGGAGVSGGTATVNLQMAMGGGGGSLERAFADIVYGLINSGQLRLRAAGTSVTT